MVSSGIKKYPKDWQECSFDVKGLLAYELCMVVLMIARGAVGAGLELAIAGLALLIITILSAVHRKKSRWHWPGASLKNAVEAIVVIVFMGCFGFLATRFFPPTNARWLPWYLALGGLTLLHALGCLRVVYYSEAEFLRDGEKEIVKRIAYRVAERG